jgi:hypothetical protein
MDGNVWYENGLPDGDGPFLLDLVLALVVAPRHFCGKQRKQNGRFHSLVCSDPSILL